MSWYRKAQTGVPMQPEQVHPIQAISQEAIAQGWSYEPPCKDKNINEKALLSGGYRYNTLISPDGHTKIALSGTDLYFHNGRVWAGDSSYWEPDRVTLTVIYTDPEVRGTGAGTKGLQFIKSIADKLGIKVTLEPVQMGGDYKTKGVKSLTTLQLIKWYKRHGWVPRYPEEGNGILEYVPPTKGQNELVSKT